MTYPHTRLITSMTIHEHFRDALHSAICNQHVDVEEETVAYVVNLLAHFTTSQALFEPTGDGPCLRPLALLYADAIDAPSLEERRRALRRLGDLALFVAGLFTDSLRRKLVDVDYYIAMGAAAYAGLNDALRGAHSRALAVHVFAELAQKFHALVDVLGEINEGANTASNSDVLRLYEVWLRTGSKRARSRLQRLGICPSDQATTRTQH